MKVYLSHLGRRIDSAYYRELLAEPPVDYILDAEDANLVITKNKFSTVEYLGKKLIEFTRVPPVRVVRKECDVVHAAHHLVYTKKPWVVDFEHVISLAGMNSDVANSFLSKKILKKFLLSENCRKVMPWTNAAKNSLFNLLGKDFEKKVKEKVEVLYPAVRLPEIKSKENDKIRLLFIGRLFFVKGGIETLMAFKELEKRYDVQLILISQIPEDIKKKYSSSNIIFEGPKPSEIIYEHYYPNADIFIYPSIVDTFGFAIIEAMSFGLPVITLENFATNEIIDDERTGFIIRGYKEKWYLKNCLHNPENNPISKLMKKIKNSHKERNRVVRDIVEKVSLLIEDNSLRKYISENARREVEKGKFSIERRNKKLKETYESSLE